MCSTSHAYVLYKHECDAREDYESAKANPVCLDDRQLIVLRYKELPKHVAPGSFFSPIILCFCALYSVGW